MCDKFIFIIVIIYELKLLLVYINRIWDWFQFKPYDGYQKPSVAEAMDVAASMPDSRRVAVRSCLW